MAYEIELKLDVTPSQLMLLKRAPWLAYYASAPGKDTRLVSVYYDTDDFTLRNHRAILRVCDANGQFVQTFKREAHGSSSGLGRLEWECPLDCPKLQLKQARKKRTDGVDLKKLAKSLKPIFEITVRRHTIPLHYHGSRLELALDHGEIKTGRRRLPIHEVEIELKAGKTDGVIALGREIADKLKAGYGAASKAERGYALREEKTGSPRFAQDIILSRQMTAAEAFQTIAMSCVHHFAGNRDAVFAGNREGVHQMRIGLRRLRAAISIFKEMLRGPETEAIKDELKRLMGELAPAREMDVLVDEAIAPMAETTPEPAAAKTLKADIVDKRDEGLKRAKRVAAGERYRRLVLDTVLWINGGKWTKTTAAPIADRRKLPAKRFAAQELGRRAREVLKQLDKIDNLSPLRRHKLRIAIKKLRYATEYFESLFASETKAIKKFSTVLENLQSSLGKLNDIRLHGKLAKGYATPTRGSRRAARMAFAMGELTGEEHAKSRDLLRTTKRRGKRLEHCPIFWE